MRIDHSDHPLPAADIVLLTRFSIGSTRLADPDDRRELARSIRAARRRQSADWHLRSYAGPYRIFDHWAPRKLA